METKKILIRTSKEKVGYKTKTGSARSVVVNPRLEVQLRAALRKGGTYLFGGHIKIHPDSVSREISRVIKKAGLTGLVPYSLRHSFITYLLSAPGASIPLAMQHAGHKRLGTTARYLHVITDELSPARGMRFNKKKS